MRVFDRPNVTTYVGPPGTGKTETTLGEVDKALSSGVPPERIAFVSFTRRAIGEARERAIKRFGFPEDRFPYFRTLHAIAFHELGLTTAQVMGKSAYDELSEILGVPFRHHYDEGVERVPQGGALGDQFMRLYSLARSQCRDHGEVWDQYNETNLPKFAYLEFVQNLEAFKEAHGLLDFTDFLDDCMSVLNVDLFVLDEAQDNTWQQWLFADRLAAMAGRVVVAGDDDQAIFQWAGADVSTFQDVSRRSQQIVLEQSHRLPETVWAFADEVAHRIGTRIPKLWRPRKDKGEVNYLTDIEQADISKGTWLLLARHRRQLDAYEKLCYQAGVVYQRDDEWSNQQPYVRAIAAYERLRGGHEVTKGQAALAMSYVEGMRATPLVTDRIRYEDIEWPFADRPDWMTALTRLSPSDREYVRSLRRNEESLVEPGRVRLSTIHSVKGGEADHVLLVTDVNRKVLQGLETDPDAEVRVWFVAVSRARHTLNIVTPRTTRFFSL